MRPRDKGVHGRPQRRPEKPEVSRVRRTAAILALVPLLLLAASGLALSHWDDEVMVTGSVSMGVFNVQMSLEDYWDNESTLDVGTITATLMDWDDGDDVYDGGANDAIEVTISNVYPGYFACVQFNIENAGTIPAKMDAPSSISDIMSFAPSFDWDTYKQYFQFNLTYLGDPADPADDILLMHLADDGTLVEDYNFATDPEGLLYLGVDEAQYFKACFGLEAGPENAPEDLMDHTISFEIVLEWYQAVP